MARCCLNCGTPPPRLKKADRASEDIAASAPSDVAIDAAPSPAAELLRASAPARFPTLLPAGLPLPELPRSPTRLDRPPMPATGDELAPEPDWDTGIFGNGNAFVPCDLVV